MVRNRSSGWVVEATGKRLAAGGMALNLIVVVLIALMVFKPGFP